MQEFRECGFVDFGALRLPDYLPVVVEAEGLQVFQLSGFDAGANPRAVEVFHPNQEAATFGAGEEPRQKCSAEVTEVEVARRAGGEPSGRGDVRGIRGVRNVSSGFGVSTFYANPFAGRGGSGEYFRGMFLNIYRDLLIRDLLGEPRKLVERGSFRGRSSRSDALVRVHDHIRYFFVLRGPDISPKTRRDLSRAQDLIEHSLGCIPLPPEGLGPSDHADGHLASAKAVCDEYLPNHLPRREAAVKKLVRRSHDRENDPALAFPNRPS